MKSSLTPRVQIVASLLCVALFGSADAWSQSATGWTGASDGNWSNPGNWTNGIPNSGSPAARILNFGPLGNGRPNPTNNMDSVSGNRIFFNLGATSYTLYLAPGTNGTILNDFSQNHHRRFRMILANVQTVDMSFKMQAKGITVAANEVGNINPTAGDIVFTTNCTVTLITNTSTFLKFFDAPSDIRVTFFGPLVKTRSG